MQNRFQLTRKESVFLAKKLWAESIYCGMRMENRNVTFPQTQTILSGVNVGGVDLNDIQAILNMRNAWSYLLSSLDNELNVNYLCSLQERVSYREALAWGELRTGNVGISGVEYVPPIPNVAEAEAALSQLLLARLSMTEIALNTFAWTARTQLFWDGNKRTALLAANKVLIKNGLGILVIPDNMMLNFTNLLREFYESGNPEELKGFLYESCILGITFSELAEKVPEPSITPDVTAKKATRTAAKEADSPALTRRTAAWLKNARLERGVTQKDLAQAISISTSAIANIEQGQRKGSAEVWEKIEQHLKD
ncbi:MAG: helix-turn-helix domain-containing protein [Coriobacteriia bacterium]|nr:helix-turn-helix domain-containing protein [Coriobacteriia bacterium]